MKKVAVVAIAIVWLCGEPRAQRWSVSQGALNERVVGLLDLPDVTGEYADDACQPKATAQVFGEPSAAAAPIGTITMRQHREFGCALLFTRAASAVEEELPTDESGYETAAAVVHERRGQWLRIALPRGTGWIQRLTTTDFLPYPQLLVQRMTYLRSDWDGDVRMEPGGLSVSLPSAWKELTPSQLAIDVVGIVRVGDEDWVQFRSAIDRCGDGRTKTLKPVEGWVRAYRSDGTTTAWFYSRGC